MCGVFGAFWVEGPKLDKVELLRTIKLIALDYTCTTTSDTEAVLKTYFARVNANGVWNSIRYWNYWNGKTKTVRDSVYSQLFRPAARFGETENGF